MMGMIAGGFMFSYLITNMFTVLNPDSMRCVPSQAATIYRGVELTSLKV